MDYQEIINKKDNLLNEANKKLYSLYEDYCKLEKKYDKNVNKHKKEIKKREENYEEMNNKLIDTFQYLSKLFVILNEGNTINNKKETENKGNNLNATRTLKNDFNKMEGNYYKQFSSDITNNLRKANTEKYNRINE